MTGLETSLSLSLTYLVEAGELSLMELLEKMTYNPAKLYNFEAGYLAENGPADITILMPRLTALWTPILLPKQLIHHSSVKP